MQPILKNFFILLLSWSAAITWAQDSPRIRSFSPADYACQNQNWSLDQSFIDGSIWVGNNGGLLEFDGAKWQLRELPGKQTVRCVSAGPNGEIFCGGFGAFGFWKKMSNGRYSYTSLSSQVPAARLAKEEIWHIFQHHGAVFFQSFSVLYKFDFQHVTEIMPPAAVMFGKAVDGHLFVPSIGQGLYELLPSDSFRLVVGTEMLRDKIVQFIVPNPRGGLWVGTSNHGIFEVNNGQCSPWANPLNELLKKHQPNKAIALRNGGWAIGTILGGLYILDAAGNLRYHIDRANGLQNNTVLALTEDRDGNLWAGLDRGIDFIQLNSPLTFFTDQSGNIGTVYSAAQWEGRFYLGTNQGVFFRPVDSRQNQDFQLVEGSQGQVWQLQVFDNQLICGHNSGTFRIERGMARKISEVTGGWCTARAFSRPDLLLQSTYTGLICFQKDKTGQWVFAHRVQGFSEPLREIMFDAQGNLWGAHPNRGLYRLRLSADFLKVVDLQSMSTADGLPADYQLDLASVGGQLYVNSEQYPVTPVSDANGKWHFASQSQARSGRYKWLPGAAGEYFVLDSTGLLLQASGAQVALPLRLVPRYENVVALPDSSYLFCLENGYAKFDRRLLRAGVFASHRPAPIIQAIETADGQAFLPAEALRFAYAHNSLKFVFAIPFFEQPPKFSWRLDGFSKQWSDWQTLPEKEFTNLPEGRYTFRVRSNVGDGEALCSFRIAPPWYRSVWAYAGGFCLLLFMLWLLEHYNRRRLLRQRQRLGSEKEKEILMLEVENQNRELSNAAFNLIRKNEALQSLKDDLLASPKDANTIHKIARRIDEHLEGDHDWEIFEESFNRVYDDFFKRLMQQFPELTPGDLRLAAYLKMNLSSKEIAPLLNISIRGIENKRYRLRKKIGLSEEANLTEFIMAF